MALHVEQYVVQLATLRERWMPHVNGRNQRPKLIAGLERRGGFDSLLPHQLYPNGRPRTGHIAKRTLEPNVDTSIQRRPLVLRCTCRGWGR